jgi:hypothetical protein
MKKLCFRLLSLQVLATLLWVSPAWAEGATAPTTPQKVPNYNVCSGQIMGETEVIHLPGASASTKDEEEKVRKAQEAVAEKSRGDCGKADANGFLEKADCTRNQMVITEVQEVIGSEIPAEEAVDGAFIMNVYRGSCCYIDNVNMECIETRSFYTEDSQKGFTACQQNTSPNYPCERRQWVIGTSGAGILKVYAKQIYTFAALTVGSVAVTNMIYSGIMITLTGSSGDITTYRERITRAILAIVLLFASGAILYTINPNFFG